MHIVMGATGHVGSALADALLARGEPVIVVTHDAAKSAGWRAKGAEVAVADIGDTNAMRRVFGRGEHLFVLNPPAAPSTDTATAERHSMADILAALDGSGLKRIVAESTYGAQLGEHNGDLGVLFEMEQALAAQPIPASIIRAAYYMSNWDTALETARNEGKVHTFFECDFKLPMVAPHDIGDFAARLMTQPQIEFGPHAVEGPRRYSSDEVAAAFASALGRPVVAESVPRERWIDTLRAMGFSAPAAESFASMTAIASEQRYEQPVDPVRGATSLQTYVSRLSGASANR